VNRQLAWRYVVEAYQTCNQKYSVMMSRFDLTSSQFDVMLVIESLDKEATPKRVAEGLLVSKANITSVTRRLLERGLIAQTKNAQDKRSIHFHLTPQGTALLKRAKAAARQFVEVQLAPFSGEEVALVGSLMQRMRGHLQSEHFSQSLEQLMADQAQEQQYD
jgi:DNA-binding MarR family transcriptional regulator